MVQESVPPLDHPVNQPEVFTDHEDDDPLVKTYMAKDGSLITKHIRPRDTLERSES